MADTDVAALLDISVKHYYRLKKTNRRSRHAHAKLLMLICDDRELLRKYMEKLNEK